MRANGRHPILAGYQKRRPAVHARLRDDRGKADGPTTVSCRDRRSASSGWTIRTRHRHGLHERSHREMGRRVARLGLDAASFGLRPFAVSCRKTSVDGLQVATREDEGKWKFDIRHTSPDGCPSTESTGTRSRSTKTATSGHERDREAGLGRYECDVPIEGHERLTVRLRDEDHDKTGLQHFHHPYPAEYRLVGMPPAVGDGPSPSPIPSSQTSGATRSAFARSLGAYFARSAASWRASCYGELKRVDSGFSLTFSGDCQPES